MTVKSTVCILYVHVCNSCDIGIEEATENQEDWQILMYYYKFTILECFYILDLEVSGKRLRNYLESETEAV